jgi:hypothetical protein
VIDIVVFFIISIIKTLIYKYFGGVNMFSLKSYKYKLLALILLMLIIVVSVPSMAYAEVLYGDVNGDGAVNSQDVTFLRRYLIGGWGVTIDPVASDVNKDGFINNQDVTLLRRYLIGGWGVTLD